MEIRQPGREQPPISAVFLRTILFYSWLELASFRLRQSDHSIQLTNRHLPGSLHQSQVEKEFLTSATIWTLTQRWAVRTPLAPLTGASPRKDRARVEKLPPIKRQPSIKKQLRLRQTALNV